MFQSNIYCKGNEMPFTDPILNVLDIFEKFPLPKSALHMGVHAGPSADMSQLQDLLFGFAKSPTAKECIYEFFNPWHDTKHAYRVRGRHVIIPEAPSEGLESFCITTSDQNRYMSIVLGALKWGINVPVNLPAFANLSRIESITVQNAVFGSVLQGDGFDYDIFDLDLREGAGRIVSDEGVFSSSRILDHLRSSSYMMVVLQKRYLEINWNIPEGYMPGSVSKLHFSTECLWYPPFGNKGVMKYMRSALQGAIGRIDNPLEVATLMVKCAVPAPQLREVLFSKSDNAAKDSQ